MFWKKLRKVIACINEVLVEFLELEFKFNIFILFLNFEGYVRKCFGTVFLTMLSFIRIKFVYNKNDKVVCLYKERKFV